MSSLALVACNNSTEEAPADETKKEDNVAKDNKKENEKDTVVKDDKAKEDKANEDKDSIEKAIKQVVLDNASAIEKEDIKAYLDGYLLGDNIDAEKAKMEAQFKKFDFKYSLDKIEVIEVKDNLATVEVLQTVKNTAEGDEYKDNQSTAKYTMELVDNKWKIKTSDIEVVKFLEDEKK